MLLIVASLASLSSPPLLLHCPRLWIGVARVPSLRLRIRDIVAAVGLSHRLALLRVSISVRLVPWYRSPSRIWLIAPPSMETMAATVA